MMDKVQKEEELKKMERVWKVFTHPLYVQNLEKNNIAEKDRIFCTHGMEHFLTVARLAYIFKLERNYNVSKEKIYITALLHDIGKWQQYQEGIPHEISSADIAEVIMKDLCFSEEEREEILHAIRTHRKGDGRTRLAEILYDADKVSRDCFACGAEGSCNWSDEKKNKKIIW